MVSRCRPVRGHGGARRNRQGLHGHQGQRLCRLGSAAARVRRALQGHRPSERLLPAAHPAELSAQGSRARGGVLARAGGGDHRRRQGTGRAVRDPSHLGNHRRALLLQVDSELARPADAAQPVGQRGALGTAHAAVSAHHRVSVAGGPYGAREPRGIARGSAAHPRHLRRSGGEPDGHAGNQGREDRGREIRGRAEELLHRSHDAERPGAAGRHQPRPGPEFRQGLRREVPEQGRAARLRLADELGREHAADRRPHHDALRRQGAGAAARSWRR